MEPRHEKIAKIALAAGARYGLALAGGYAVQAHGIGARPSGDVDLFTSWHHRDEFPQLASAVIAALDETGYTTTVAMRAETFVRLMVTDRADGAVEKVELSADWRAHDPVLLDIGPVLHADDAIANKMCALFGRAMQRDFLDVDAAIMSGRYTRRESLDLAAATDPGFDPLVFADALGALTQITDTAFAEYKADPGSVAEMRRRFADWRAQLLADTPRPS
ncbi:nucleotidyl transferase AbiEii/AbiGii toxin family protein [Frankia sp. CiP3]|uniref:nucleotidyl transferase AbiEii/AbiGii toxin family protein n=1 Tax=Frankia sp. CiP3 TaxID=2880971 RepID=UPI001EF473D0|nr:nucleotidyl transferase AbiEii/AbiGii toxin family protein [Frankia sp. CiP3]